MPDEYPERMGFKRVLLLAAGAALGVIATDRIIHYVRKQSTTQGGVRK